MCRFMIYKGREEMVLSDLLTKPAHSIINQSFDSRLRLDMRNPLTVMDLVLDIIQKTVILVYLKP